MLSILTKHDFRLKLSKCGFGQTEFRFLGHIISEGTVRVDQDKVKALCSWERPKNLRELQQFLGLANYFRRFIPRYSLIAAPLTSLTSATRAKNFDWGAWPLAQREAFNSLKSALTSPDVMLHLPDLEAPFSVHADASDTGCGAILMQKDKPVAYLSHKFSPTEQNWPTGDRELYALIHACHHWRCYLEGTSVELLTDHNPITYLTTKSTLSRRQARWLEFLSRFDFRITYIKGSKNPADGLSRLFHSPAGQDIPRLPDSPVPLAALSLLASRLQKSAGLLRSHQPTSPSGGAGTALHTTEPATQQNGTPAAASPQPASTDVDPPALQSPVPTLTDAIRDGYAADARFTTASGTKHLRFDTSSGLWYLGPKVVVPSIPALHQRIISEHHDPAWAGHRGALKTYKLIERSFY